MDKFWEDLFAYPMQYGPFGLLNFPIFLILYSGIAFIIISVIFAAISELFTKVIIPAAQRLLLLILTAPLKLVLFLLLISFRYLARLLPKRRKVPTVPLPPPSPAVAAPNPSRPPFDKDLFEQLVGTEYYHPRGWLH